MAAKIEIQGAAVLNAPLRIHVDGLRKGASHQLTITPPTGDAQNRVLISDPQGEITDSIYPYAPGKWKIEAFLNPAESAVAEATFTV